MTRSAKPVLFVEGSDDEHVIKHLLTRYLVPRGQLPVPTSLPEFKVSGGKTQLLRSVKAGVSSSTGKSIGFVLDANASLQDCWRAISLRLGEIDMPVPRIISPQGFVADSSRYGARVGVWIMPDNQHEGKLEHFLHTLVQAGDVLFAHACEATETAKALGAKYKDIDKAKLHAWLAWQEEPGLPYGLAIKARYFRHDSAAAKGFVTWFCSLFGID